MCVMWYVRLLASGAVSQSEVRVAQPTHSPVVHRSPAISAWAILLTYFLLFCILVAAGAYFGLNYFNTALVSVPGSLLRSHVNTGVVVQPRGQLTPLSIVRLPAGRDPCPSSQDICNVLTEGASVKTQPEAGYGPVASLVLPDQSHIQLWASPNGADLTLARYQVTQWNDRQQIVQLTQHAGYVRYDIAKGQAYKQIVYEVQTDSGTRIDLELGGSYSIFIPGATDSRHAVDSHGTPIMLEVAVRSGKATISHGYRQQEISIHEKIQLNIAGVLSDPQPAAWELIADGDFAQFQQQHEYLDGSETWRRAWTPNVAGMSAEELNGDFGVVKACRPQTPDLCLPSEQLFIGQFRRTGNQLKPFTTGIFQHLEADVSEYTSLRLRGWVRVLNQSIEGAGAQGSECPILIWLKYKPTSPTDQEQDRFFCIYSVDNGLTDIPDLQNIRYKPVPRFQWYYLDIELRDDSLIRQARYLQLLRVEARGHDYLTEVTGLSLVGTQ